MNYPNLRFICAVVFPLAAFAASQAAPASAAPGEMLRVSVADVVETRATVGAASECRLFLTLTGDATMGTGRIRRIQVEKAEDDRGHDLALPSDGTAAQARGGLAGIPEGSRIVNPNPEMEQTRLEAVAAEVSRRRMMRDQAAAAMGAPPYGGNTALVAAPPPIAMRPVLVLRAPARSASAIKRVEGQIEWFDPTEANGGLIKLSHITARTGEPAGDGALETLGITLMPLGPAAARPSNPKDLWTEEVAAQFQTLVTQTSALPGTKLYFFLHDPKRLIVDFELQTADGRPIGASVARSVGSLRMLRLPNAMPADPQLMLRVAAPGAIKSYPFKFENVPLP